MPPAPQFRSCVVCELVRPELEGKLIVLGYFGVCPQVTVGIQHIDQPTFLTFLMAGDPADGTFSATVHVVDESDQRVVASTAEMPVMATPGAITLVAPTLLMTFGRPGLYSVRLNFGEEENFRGEFHIAQGIPSLGR